METVLTPYNHKTKDLGKYIRNKLKRAKNLYSIFKKLEKENYRVVIEDDNFGGEPCKKATITGLFNGIVHDVIVHFIDKTNKEDGYYQHLIGILY